MSWLTAALDFSRTLIRFKIPLHQSREAFQQSSCGVFPEVIKSCFQLRHDLAPGNLLRVPGVRLSTRALRSYKIWDNWRFWEPSQAC